MIEELACLNGYGHDNKNDQLWGFCFFSYEEDLIKIIAKNFYNFLKYLNLFILFKKQFKNLIPLMKTSL